MTRAARYWVGGTALACALLVVALVPPNEWFRPFITRFAWGEPSERGLRMIERRLLEARTALRTLETADSVVRRGAWRRSVVDPVLAVQSGIPEAAYRHLDSILAPARDRLGDLDPNVTLVVAVVYDTATRGRPRGSNWRRTGVQYVLPEALDGSRCVAIANASRFVWIHSREGSPPTAQRMRDILEPRPRASLAGPCGYLAAFGAPGDSVRAWLDRFVWRQALEPQWLFQRGLRRLGERVPPNALWRGQLARQQRHALAENPDLYGCAAGRHASCRAAHAGGLRRYDGNRPSTGPEPAVMEFEISYLVNSSLGPGTDVFLSDLVADRGVERVRRFWQSDLPLDSAFAQAFDVSIEDWTMQWVRSYLGVPPAGPTVRFVPGLLGLLAVGVLLGGASVWVRFRQVV